ncbi:MAG: ATP-dependent Clp protease proteolytic subunit [Clostridiales bacterium]|jgi:ATP-dependent Clp protease protease subunit|uniref:ClpP family protease n=1 Tax=Terrisporobacter sp. TaxID=1965305 RepID=UPI002A50792A|nr:ATP-dependent Clp protease proteolytic subunit [Terrisporobacter sp.]MDD7756327.1 ATP-dependent Clp protease proteolytic subunit [Clostridiales bacterium]MDY4135706.1 ATP-dependent Clp protease proteolytic subunit [Terrisporobacter sp.]
MNLEKDFNLFAKSKGISSSTLLRVNNSALPYVLEERRLNVQALDIYSRLLYDRIIYMGEEFTPESCNLIVTQLLYLNNLSNDPIDIYINSSGGSVIDGLSIIDTINLIKSPVNTICTGLAASMGAVLLSCGKKGSRAVLPHSRVMIHQVSSGMWGTFSDLEIELKQTERCKQDIYKILAENLNKPYEEIEKLCDRNNWFIGQEAVDLGIVDKVLCK